jgi:hypothetical protein
VELLKCNSSGLLDSRFLWSWRGAVIGLLLGTLVAGCSAARGISEIRSHPYPVVQEDDAAEKLMDENDTVFIEVRKAKVGGPVDNLAIRYRSLFPEGEAIRPGDREEYVDIDGKKAYRVVFRTKYIRRRKRLESALKPENLPEGATIRSILDPATGESVPVLYGPVIPRQKILYLVEGKQYIYYILLRADGDSIGPAQKKFKEFVRNGIEYR